MISRLIVYDQATLYLAYVRALITRKILRSKEAQCNTKESPVAMTTCVLHL